jgi:hypothetical protein
VGTPQYIPPEIFLRWKARQLRMEHEHAAAWRRVCVAHRARDVIWLQRLLAPPFTTWVPGDDADKMHAREAAVNARFDAARAAEEEMSDRSLAGAALLRCAAAVFAAEFDQPCPNVPRPLRRALVRSLGEERVARAEADARLGTANSSEMFVAVPANEPQPPALPPGASARALRDWKQRFHWDRACKGRASLARLVVSSMRTISAFSPYYSSRDAARLHRPREPCSDEAMSEWEADEYESRSMFCAGLHLLRRCLSEVPGAGLDAAACARAGDRRVPHCKAIDVVRNWLPRSFVRQADDEELEALLAAVRTPELDGAVEAATLLRETARDDARKSADIINDSLRQKYAIEDDQARRKQLREEQGVAQSESEREDDLDDMAEIEEAVRINLSRYRIEGSTAAVVGSAALEPEAPRFPSALRDPGPLMPTLLCEPAELDPFGGWQFERPHAPPRVRLEDLRAIDRVVREGYDGE